MNWISVTLAVRTDKDFGPKWVEGPEMTINPGVFMGIRETSDGKSSLITLYGAELRLWHTKSDFLKMVNGGFFNLDNLKVVPEPELPPLAPKRPKE